MATGISPDVAFFEGVFALPAQALYGGAVLLIILSLVTLRLLSNTFTFGKPPVFEGLPFVGGLIKFSKGPMRLLAEGYGKYGEVFTVPVAHRNITFLIGPQVSSHFFKAKDEELSQTEVYQFNVPTFGPGVVYDVDHTIRAEQIRFFAAALQSSRLNSYVPHFVKEAQDFFAKWADEGVVDLKEQLSELIILTASRTLMGREVREQMFAQVADLFHDLDMGMRPISVLFPYLPIPAHRKRDQSRAELARVFAKIIQARRANNVKEDDVLQTFIDSRYKNVYGGRYTNDEEITGFLIATLFAGQHTSSITSAWTGYYMMANKATTMDPAVAEQQALMRQHGGEITMDVLNKMDALHANMSEALRMHPPLVMLMRYVRQAFSVTSSRGQTYHIPQGHVVATSPAFAHTLPEVFERPGAYEPARFQPPREEDKRVPFSFIGFGGGRHGCMGSNFAYLQIKAIWAVLLRNFEFELVDPFPEPDYESMVVGPKPCRIRYRRRKLLA